MTGMDKEKQEYRKTMMLTEPLPRVITKMAVPSIISFLITSIYNLADTFFVSSLGTNATAAVSVNASLDQIIMMAGSMLLYLPPPGRQEGGEGQPGPLLRLLPGRGLRRCGDGPGSHLHDAHGPAAGRYGYLRAVRH